MGRSLRQLSTARASGFDTLRRLTRLPPFRLLDSEYSEEKRCQCSCSSVTRTGAGNPRAPGGAPGHGYCALVTATESWSGSSGAAGDLAGSEGRGLVREGLVFGLGLDLVGPGLGLGGAGLGGLGAGLAPGVAGPVGVVGLFGDVRPVGVCGLVGGVACPLGGQVCGGGGHRGVGGGSGGGDRGGGGDVGVAAAGHPGGQGPFQGARGGGRVLGPADGADLEGAGGLLLVVGPAQRLQLARAGPATAALPGGVARPVGGAVVEVAAAGGGGAAGGHAHPVPRLDQAGPPGGRGGAGAPTWGGGPPGAGA